MKAFKKFVLASVRGMARLIGAGAWMEQRMESVWRFMHRREVIENLEAFVASFRNDIERMGREKESLTKEKEKLFETLVVPTQRKSPSRTYGLP